MKATDIAWLAGIIEGEGTIYVPKARKQGMHIAIAMNDEDVIRRAAKLFDTPATFASSKARPAGFWRVSACGTRAAEWLMTVYSQLGARRKERARAALTYWKGSRKLRTRVFYKEAA
jgi:hypothetical protein